MHRGTNRQYHTEAGESTVLEEVSAAPDADEWLQAIVKELHGFGGKTIFQGCKMPVEHKVNQEVLRLQTETRGRWKSLKELYRGKGWILSRQSS